MKKLLVRAPINEENLKKLEAFFEEIEYWPWNDTGKRLNEDEMIEVLDEKKPDAIITELDVISEKVLESYPNLKFIGDCRSTPENIDVEACNKRGIPILCTPARNANAVAELWVSTLIAFERNLVKSVNWVKDGEWVKGTTPYYLFMGNEISKKKIGFVGFGAVPRKIVNLLTGFNVDISFYDPFIEEDSENKKVELETIFTDNDYVSIHLPANDQTKNLISEDLISRMKKNSLLINSSRSTVVDNNFLYSALKNKDLRGAILDVLDTEPPSKEDLEISYLDNVLLTPHTYGATFQVIDHQSDIITRNITNFYNKENIEKSVYNYTEIYGSL